MGLLTQVSLALESVLLRSRLGDLPATAVNVSETLPHCQWWSHLGARSTTSVQFALDPLVTLHTTRVHILDVLKQGALILRGHVLHKMRDDFLSVRYPSSIHATFLFISSIMRVYGSARVRCYERRTSGRRRRTYVFLRGFNGCAHIHHSSTLAMALDANDLQVRGFAMGSLYRK